MRIVLAIAALLLGLAPAVAQKPNETDGSANVLNSLMLKTTQRCFALTGEERSACCRRYFDNYCGESAEPAAMPTPTPAAALPAASPPRAIPVAAPSHGWRMRSRLSNNEVEVHDREPAGPYA